MKKNTPFFLLVLLLIQSCSIEKRLYNKGFHVENNFFKKEKANPYNNSPLSTEVPNFEPEEFEYLTEVETNDHIVIPQKKKSHKKNDNCDIIILKSGKEISCKIIEANNNEVIYTFCDSENSYTQSVSAAEVKSIKYGNTSSKEEEKTNEPDYYEPSKTSTTFNSSQNENEKKVKTWAIISFICGLFSLMFLLFIPAIYLGRKALKEYQLHPEYKGKLFAELGFLFGIVTATLFALSIIIIFILFL